MDNQSTISCSFKIRDAAGTVLQKAGIALKPQTLCIMAIIIIALMLRLHFFIGFAGGDPQDDGIYLNIAKEILQNGFSDHTVQKALIAKAPVINPVHMFPSRILMTYSTAFSFFLFGVNDYSATLFPLLCSLLSIYLVYRIGLLLFTARAGLLAAFFLAIMPIDIVFSTRITPDVPIAFFMMLSIYLFLKGLKANTAIWFFTSGLAIGAGYLAKESAIPVIVYMVFVTLVTCITRKKFPTPCLHFITGMCAVICLECLYYQLLTGMPTLRFQLIPKILKIKYAEEYTFLTINLNWLLIKYQPDSFFTHLKTLLNTSSSGSEIGLRHFGVFYYPVFISLLWVAAAKIKKSWLIISWLILLYLYLEFGPVGISLGQDPLITYELICKSSRFLTMLSGPACLLLALWLTCWSDRYKYIIAGLIIGILVQTSYANVSSSVAVYRKHTRDLQEAEQYFRTGPQRKIYADLWARDMLYYYSGYRLKAPLHDIGHIVRKPGNPEFKDSYVIIGGARGSGVVAGYFERKYRDLFSQIPENWVAVKKISGDTDSFRHRDLTIYYIPQ